MGIKGLPLRKTFFYFFYIVKKLPLKIKKKFAIDNFSTYGRCWSIFFNWFVAIFPKNKALLVKKIGGGGQSKFVSSYLKKNKKKFRLPLSSKGGGGKALMALTLRK